MPDLEAPKEYLHGAHPIRQLNLGLQTELPEVIAKSTALRILRVAQRAQFGQLNRENDAAQYEHVQ